MAKQYDRTELLDRAIELFRRQGFNGTSTAELVAELGVNRKSMYAEFGSKQKIFEAALERYSEKHLARVLAPVAGPDAGIAAIKQAFAGYALASEGRFRGLGCLLCNTAVERGAQDPGSSRYVTAYFERVQRAFRQALANSQRLGEIDGAAGLDETAAFLTTAMMGFAACVRAEAPSGQLSAASRVVTRVLDALRTPPRT